MQTGTTTSTNDQGVGGQDNGRLRGQRKGYRDNKERDTGEQSSASEKEELEDQIFDLEFNIGRSKRYYSRRCTHYEKLSKLTTAASLIGGTTVVTQLLSQQDSVLLSGAVLLAALNALSLVFGWPEKANQFASLYRRYAELEVELTSAEPVTDLAKLQPFKTKYKIIEVDEPQILSVLMIICRNEESVSRGIHDVVKIWFWQSMFANYTSLWPHGWKPTTPEKGPELN